MTTFTKYPDSVFTILYQVLNHSISRIQVQKVSQGNKRNASDFKCPPKACVIHSWLPVQCYCWKVAYPFRGRAQESFLLLLLLFFLFCVVFVVVFRQLDAYRYRVLPTPFSLSLLGHEGISFALSHSPSTICSLSQRVFYFCDKTLVKRTWSGKSLSYTLQFIMQSRS